MPSAAALATALQPMATALEADGYAMTVADDASGVVVRVTAGPDACAECLVPKELMLSLIRQAAGDVGDSVTLVYPTDDA
jgi:hypothetical protein